ncbi:MAG: proline--tRNA ligase [Burkholderiales bacterium]|nr:proline--tRNA ligase [Burkholderiales bacterium]
MRTSHYYIYTAKEIPAEAELISHQLMLRAGLIKRLTSGIYTWLPLGLKVIRKIEKIVREEMNQIGALEVLMPSIQPSEIWEESGRWDMYGKELLRIKDRHNRDFCFGPTHEEVIVDIVKKDVKSYKQLPLCIYQIQTKFRDEVRPRFGVMRAREFIMKDAYSFHTDFASLEITYNNMYQAYCNIFQRIGLKFRAVNADTGSIGGTGSHELQVLADSGEDIIAYSDESSYAANIELAVAAPSRSVRNSPQQALQKIVTPTQKTCSEVAQLLNVSLASTVKSLVFEGVDNQPILVLIRGDHELNEIKIGKIKCIKNPLIFANLEVIKENFNCSSGFIGPVGFKGVIVADSEVALMSDFICGANLDGYHLSGVNFGRDCSEPTIVADIRNVVEGDITPDGTGRFKLCRGIEVGHVFQLRTKYSEVMNALYLNPHGSAQFMEMGCYGIGVSRIAAAAIEQSHDKNGIIFPVSIAPFEVIITPANYHKSELTKNAADSLYTQLKDSGVDVLLDDRNERMGSLLADSELLGIPYRITLGEKTLVNNNVELYIRQTGNIQVVSLDDIVGQTIALVNN